MRLQMLHLVFFNQPRPPLLMRSPFRRMIKFWRRAKKYLVIPTTIPKLEKPLPQSFQTHYFYASVKEKMFN